MRPSIPGAQISGLHEINVNGMFFQMEESADATTGIWVSAATFLCVQLTGYLKGVIPFPNTPSEAELLLKTVRAECKLRKSQKECADQLVQYNMLRLEYSRLQVQQAEQHLLEAETHVGRARLVIRRCGYPSGFGTGSDDPGEHNS